MRLMPNACVPSESPELGARATRRLPTRSASLGGNVTHAWPQLITAGEEGCPAWLPGGDSWQLSAAHSRPLPFSLAVTDRSHERDSMLSPGHPPIKPLDHGVVLGTPNRVSDPRISRLLSASMKLWQAELDLK